MNTPDIRPFQTRHGAMMALAGDRYISRSLELYGEFSGAEWEMLAQLVKPGMTVVEVGANIGAHSVAMAAKCFPGPLYLFEPQQRIFQLLCANLVLNGVRNAIAFPEACGEAEGRVVIPHLDYGAEFNFGGVSVKPDEAGLTGQRVRCTPLDSLQLAACNLIKLDVEGYEAQVLRGATETIRKHRPLLYVENDRPQHQQEVISLIDSLGYRQYWHLPPLFRPDNFNGNPQNVFADIVSVNLLCLPRELGTVVKGLQLIDPENWTSPIRPPG